MDVFLWEWANLLIRWMHLIVGIGWVGTSFYFMGLDYSLNKAGPKKEGVLGTAWQVHGGGFYHVEKYSVAPAQMPDHLHWFRWESYLTWVSGFALLIVQYYVNARSYLIDPAVLALTPWQAIAISVGSIFIGWGIYELLCRSPIGQNTTLLALSFFAFILLASVFYTHVFSARGAFLHVGALTGSIMATNVFAIIMPCQTKMVAQLIRGETPNPYYGMIGKQRSTHNNYLTLPVLVMMVSPHYPFLSSHPQSWMVVALIFIAGASIRHYLNRVDAGDDWNKYGWTAPVAIAALMVAIFITAPKTREGGAAVSDAEALAITQKHCVMCHSVKPSHVAFQEAPKSITLDTIADLRRHAALIYVQAVQNRAMPLGNETGITEDEREALGRWVKAQH